MKLRFVLTLTALLLAPPAPLHSAEGKPLRPNIVFILADDEYDNSVVADHRSGGNPPTKQRDWRSSRQPVNCGGLLVTRAKSGALTTRCYISPTSPVEGSGAGFLAYLAVGRSWGFCAQVVERQLTAAPARAPRAL